MTNNLLAENVEALVNTVNCVGVMGKGIALQFKKTFPKNFKAYAAACLKNEVQIGDMFVFETGYIVYPYYIINFPTKRHWKNKSRLEYIDAGLISLVEEIHLRNIKSIAIPPLGCGLGGLDWHDVQSKIENALQQITNLKIIIYEPKKDL